ncbi:MAG: endonuclease/exonuclease/phosphatase family protein [Bacillota bacterium]
MRRVFSVLSFLLSCRRGPVRLLFSFFLPTMVFIPAARAHERQEIRLRVATFNIHHGANARDLPNLRAVAALIRRIEPEVIALQEVDRRFGLRSLWRDQAVWLAKALGMECVFAATIDRRPRLPGHGEYGLAVLSRLPILAADFLLLPGELEQRGVLLVWVQKEGEAFPVGCTHLGLSSEDRRRQVASLLRWLPAHPGVLLLGDFNMEATAPALQEVAKNLLDLQAACGQGHEGTYSHHGRPVRIDYLFAGPAWRPLVCRLVPSRASDHRPVVAELILDTNCQPMNLISVDN